MHAFTADITDECCKNTKVEAGVICFDRLFQVHLCQQLAQQIKKNKKKQDQLQIFILICLFWSFSLFCCSFMSDFRTFFHPEFIVIGRVHATYVFLVITEKALKLFPVWQPEACKICLIYLVMKGELAPHVLKHVVFMTFRR